jgi:hypothetical protein
LILFAFIKKSFWLNKPKGFFLNQDFDGFEGRTSTLLGKVLEGICNRSATICPISSG